MPWLAMAQGECLTRTCWGTRRLLVGTEPQTVSVCHLQVELYPRAAQILASGDRKEILHMDASCVPCAEQATRITHTLVLSCCLVAAHVAHYTAFLCSGQGRLRVALAACVPPCPLRMRVKPAF